MLPSNQARASGELAVDRETHAIVLTRMFAATREQVFEAWTRPEHVTCWWDPTGRPLAECEIDLRPGGTFRFVNQQSAGAHDFAGVYRETHRRIIWSSKRWARPVASSSKKLAAGRV
jgi:uncharacterized protein YndB with AHSA1/START domain